MHCLLSGSFGTVHHADWHGSEVAVKILMEQDFDTERIKEFLRCNHWDGASYSCWVGAVF
uniref:Protein kinase domain-containing protein n=1 Tax=Manihot esculenta TaxID=3983 RepID=A0A199UBF0_MANES